MDVDRNTSLRSASENFAVATTRIIVIAIKFHGFVAEKWYLKLAYCNINSLESILTILRRLVLKIIFCNKKCKKYRIYYKHMEHLDVK